MDLEGKVWARWRSVPPPKQTVVYGHYGDERPSQRGRTCKRGCCWDCGFGSQVLPTWWSPCDDQTSPLPYEGFKIPDPFASAVSRPIKALRT